MRRWALVVAATAVPVAAACGEPQTVPQAKSPAPASAAPGVVAGTIASPSVTNPLAVAAPASSEKRFVAAVRDRLPEVAVDRRPEEITEMGGEACAGLTAGRRRATVAEELARYGVAGTDAGELVTLARAHLCRT